MGILNIDEHVEEHRLMAIRYPSKAVIPGQMVVATVGIPFLIMPGDGAASGCQFTGAAGAATLSAAIIANIGTSLSGCYVYLSDNFGGLTISSGWFWAEFSTDTALIVYNNRYTTGTPRVPTTKTPFATNLTGWVTAPTTEITGPTGFILPSEALGKNGTLQVFIRQCGSTSGTKTFKLRNAASDIFINTGSTTNPVVETLHTICCCDSTSRKILGRTTTSVPTGVQSAINAYLAVNVINSETENGAVFSFTLQQSTNVLGTILLNAYITATYGD
jgi:hypothetical protein